MFDELVRAFLATFYFYIGTGRSDVEATSIFFRLEVRIGLVLFWSWVGG